MTRPYAGVRSAGFRKALLKHALNSTLAFLWRRRKRLRHKRPKSSAIFRRRNLIMTLKNIKRRTLPFNLQLTAHLT
jgi:hypothetical protein